MVDKNGTEHGQLAFHFDSVCIGPTNFAEQGPILVNPALIMRCVY